MSNFIHVQNITLGAFVLDKPNVYMSKRGFRICQFRVQALRDPGNPSDTKPVVPILVHGSTADWAAGNLLAGSHVLIQGRLAAKVSDPTALLIRGDQLMLLAEPQRRPGTLLPAEDPDETPSGEPELPEPAG